MNDLLRSEWRSGIDPELQVELQFGIEQSKGQSESDLFELANLFLDQGDDWQNAERELSALKDGKTEVVPDTLPALEASANHEIAYVTDLWNGNYATALESAQQVIDSLSGGDELKGFRGMWHYLSGCAAFALNPEEGGDNSKADRHFKLARTVAGMQVAGLHQDGNAPDWPASPLDQAAIQLLETELCELGLVHSMRFTSLELEIRKEVDQGRGKAFESGHQKLGELLGFNSQNSFEEGAPDPRWLVGSDLCFVFEDHIKENDGDALSLEKARQAASHPKWVEANISALRNDAEIIPVLITNASADKSECQLHLQDVAVWPLEEFRNWAKEALSAVRELRTRLGSRGDLAWRAEAISSLQAISATPSTLREKLQGMRIPMPLHPTQPMKRDA